MQAESTTAAAQFIDFQPTQEAASDILTALVDPDHTLSEIARRFHTTIDALADWLDSPPVLQRIEKMKRVIANRDALILTAHFRAALAVLVSLIEAHQHDEQHIPVDPQNLRAVTQRDRRRAAARLAASQLIRLAGSTPAHSTSEPMRPARRAGPPKNEESENNSLSVFKRLDKRLGRDVAPGGLERGGEGGLVDSAAAELDVGCARRAPGAGGGREDVGVGLEERGLVFGGELDHAEAGLGGVEGCENLAAHAEVGVAHVGGFLGVGEGEGEGAKVVGSHETKFPNGKWQRAKFGGG